MARKKKKKNGDRKKQALGILLFLVALLVLVSLVSHNSLDDSRLAGEVDSHLNPFKIKYNNQAGMAGVVIAFYLLKTIGWLAFFIPLGLIFLSLRLFASEFANRFEINSVVLFGSCLIATMLYNVHIIAERSLDIVSPTAGGIVADRLTFVAIKLVGELGSYILMGGLILILLVLFTSFTPAVSLKFSLPGKSVIGGVVTAIGGGFKRFFRFEWWPSLFESSSREEDDEYEDAEDNETASFDSDSGDEVETDEGFEEEEDSFEKITDDLHSSQTSSQSSTKRKLKTVKPAEQLQLESVMYKYPSIDSLAESPEDQAHMDEGELSMTARMLAETLQTFGVRIDGEIETFPGPVITRFEFKPASGIKVNQILNLSDDLALALKAKRIRIIAPIPGKAAVGVEIPNRHPQIVVIKDILASEQFRDSKLRLPLALGKTTSGHPFVIDLAKLPHLLIAGATGSGKSVCMNILITSLLYRLHPYQVRFIMIDPKMLELSVYKDIPHLGRPVVTNPRRAEKVLADAVAEMEKRYRKLANASVRNIEDFNGKQTDEKAKLPYIVIFIDELADLMMSATSSKTEMLITRLAQMARAVGIHLIIATQRPSVDVITGLIKANFPARIAFQVSSKVDSRTIIDANGAEKLLGNGDMLFLSSGQPETIRIHGAYLSNEETEGIVDFIRDQGLEVMPLEGISQATGEVTETEIDIGDPLFKEACEVVVRHKQGSVSLLQRRLGIGYQRAARLIDKLEQAGIVSVFDGSKAREVLVDQAHIDAIFAVQETTGAGQQSN